MIQLLLYNSHVGVIPPLSGQRHTRMNNPRDKGEYNRKGMALICPKVYKSEPPGDMMTLCWVGLLIKICCKLKRRNLKVRESLYSEEKEIVRL